MEHFINYHTEINQLVTSLKETIEFIYGEKLNLFKDKINWKYGGGEGFKAHQDQPAWTDFPPSRYVTLALFANNTNNDNGCLQFVNACHKNGLYEYDENGNGEIKLDNQNKMEWNYISTTPRDILLFDSYAPHRSYKNTTDKSRRIFYFTYNEEKYGDLYKKYFEKKRQELPPDIERDSDKVYNLDGNKYNLANPIV